MKQTKKWAALFLTAAMICLAAGCGGDNKKDTAPATAGSGRTTEVGTESGAKDTETQGKSTEAPENFSEGMEDLKEDVSKGAEDLKEDISEGVHDASEDISRGLDDMGGTESSTAK